MAEESTKEPEIKLSPPYEIELSDKVKGRYGFKNSRVEVDILLPFPFNKIKKSVTISLTPEEVKNLAIAIEKANIWSSLPDYQRERDGAE